MIFHSKIPLDLSPRPILELLILLPANVVHNQNHGLPRRYCIPAKFKPLNRLGKLKLIFSSAAERANEGERDFDFQSQFFSYNKRGKSGGKYTTHNEWTREGCSCPALRRAHDFLRIEIWTDLFSCKPTELTLCSALVYAAAGVVCCLR